MLKSEGIFLICNESDGTNAADEKWTKMINGMKIYTCLLYTSQLLTYSKQAEAGIHQKAIQMLLGAGNNKKQDSLSISDALEIEKLHEYNRNFARKTTGEIVETPQN